MKRDTINRRINRIPLHVIVIFTMIIWLVPTIGLLVTSFRPLPLINTTGWWTFLAPPRGTSAYNNDCASCHGKDGKLITAADLSNPTLTAKYSRSTQLENVLKQQINGQPHMGTEAVPDINNIADIAAYLQRLSGLDKTPTLTTSNYVDAIVGYRGNQTYRADCAAGTQAVDLNCNFSDVLNPRGMGRAFLNSVIVTIPATVLPILFAAFAGYAFSWNIYPRR